jgi:hypothetical protein
VITLTSIAGGLLALVLITTGQPVQDVSVAVLALIGLAVIIQRVIEVVW